MKLTSKIPDQINPRKECLRLLRAVRRINRQHFDDDAMDTLLIRCMIRATVSKHRCPINYKASGPAEPRTDRRRPRT